jgi:putative spermidine/putrescine transport system ATP-binding protein
MAQLELQELQKRFGEVVALRGLDLSLKSGEFVSLLGPSGCGKTTALRIVAGFEHPDSGRVVVDGKDVTSVPANRRDMGMVFQAYSLFPNLTAQQNVEFGLRVRRVSRGERARRAAELLGLVGLASAVNRYPHQLSGGQQQRVALARALAIEPSVLLLDEPLSALDAKVRVQLREEIRRIQQELGITALYVTHDQEEALSISDRVVVLSQGQIEQVGPPAEIYGAPRTVFVAEFIGTMNRIEGTVSAARHDESGGYVECDGFRLPVAAARDCRGGERVLVLIRPEVIELDSLNGKAQDESGGYGRSDHRLEGSVVSHTFLGSVTRLNVSSLIGELMVDVPSAAALSLGVGTRVTLDWDAESPRLIKLPESPALGPPDSSVDHDEADLPEDELQQPEISPILQSFDETRTK